MSYYNEIHEGYEELYGREQEKKFNKVRELVKFCEDHSVLDVGCGNGAITHKVSEMVKNVTGVDNSKRMLEKARELKRKEEKGNIDYTKVDAEALPFEDSSFDIVISMTMLQDIPNWDPVLKEMKRVCRDRAVITLLKRGKKKKEVKEKLEKFFNIKDELEEEKDYIFLVKPGD